MKGTIGGQAPHNSLILLLFLSIVIVGTYFLPRETAAVDWRTLPQPPGTIIDVLDPNAVNAYLATKGYTNPPFDTGTEVTDIVTTRPLVFVRVYAPPSTGIGSWIMRASEIRGLTPEQIKNVFALQNIPASVAYVIVPSGSTIYTGIAAPISGWGNGGAIQSYLYYYIPVNSFQHFQALGSQALLYAPAIGRTGNAGSIAAYLDLLRPVPYSSLDDVYSALDYLNYGNLDPLRAALNGVGPEKYDALTRIGMRNSMLFGDAVVKRSRSEVPMARTGDGDGSGGIGLQQNPNLWFQGIGEFGDQGGAGEHTGFDFNTGGFLLGADLLRFEQMTFGAAVSYLRTNLDWDGNGGDARMNATRWGIYGNYGGTTGFFVDGLLAGGYDWTTANRNIDFLYVSETTRANVSAFDMAARIRAGYAFKVSELYVSPVADLSYYLQHRSGFEESGSDSLDLDVRSGEYQTFRTQLGIRTEKDIIVKGMQITPALEVSWAHEVPLDSRGIEAGLVNQPGSFSVYGVSGDFDSVVVDAGLKVLLTKNMTLFTRYQAEVGDRFSSHQAGLGLGYRF